MTAYAAALPVYSDIAWFPLCGGLTALGIVLSYYAWRKRGVMAGLRGLAWSLLPLAAYLTGVVRLIWTIISAVADFAWSTIFSFQGWLGIGVTGVAFVLFVVTGLAKRVRGGGKGDAKPGTAVTKAGMAGGAAATKPSKAVGGKRSSPAADDDGLGDVADILRKHGIK